MDQGQVMDIFREALIVCLKLAGPMLIISIVIGLLVSIFQAATQIHEQTLT
ncbi:MAG: flagellar biosynthetic protein FliQ, partial [Oscillospiraceae bacterium]